MKIVAGEGKKKTRNFGPPTLRGPPPFGAPLFLGLGQHPSILHPLGPNSPGPHPFGNPFRTQPSGPTLRAPQDPPPSDRPKFRVFFSLSRHNFCLSSLSLGVFSEFWWCLKRWDPQMCTFGVYKLSCETPAAFAKCQEQFTIDLPHSFPFLDFRKINDQLSQIMFASRKKDTNTTEIPQDALPPSGPPLGPHFFWVVVCSLSCS